MNDSASDWPADLHRLLRAEGVTQVCHVPDTGHARLIDLCNADNDVSVVTLTSEEEGIHMLAGVWLGGAKGAMLLQSSGVGNIMNALAMPNTCRIPLLLLVTMRGEWGEFNSWQVPMGQGTPAVLEAMGVRVIRVTEAEEIADTVKAAARLAFDSLQMVAVLISQKILGFKDFRELAK
jgi:sulfopyruvate decarboxylase alpha subunit